jgi:hypothetical protein
LTDESTVTFYPHCRMVSSVNLSFSAKCGKTAAERFSSQNI